ncbi:hypothetical protein Gpo141_00006550 [Globisporangium polare]
MRRYEEARSLLEKLVGDVATERSHKGELRVGCTDPPTGNFLPKKSWSTIDVSSANAAELKNARALIDAISWLSGSADFRWREFYHTFWKDALMTPLRCSKCGGSCGGIPNTTSYDNIE